MFECFDQYVSPYLTYCRFGNFHENNIFAKSIKGNISDVKNSRLRQDLPIPINERVILPFREGFIFNKVLAKISEFTVAIQLLYCENRHIFIALFK